MDRHFGNTVLLARLFPVCFSLSSVVAPFSLFLPFSIWNASMNNLLQAMGGGGAGGAAVRRRSCESDAAVVFPLDTLVSSLILFSILPLSFAFFCFLSLLFSLFLRATCLRWTRAKLCTFRRSRCSRCETRKSYTSLTDGEPQKPAST